MKHIPTSRPYLPPDYDKADVAAVKALADGSATPDQQKRALNWIIYQACGTYNWSYSIHDARETDIVLGRQFVGQQVVKMINLDYRVFKEKK